MRERCVEMPTRRNLLEMVGAITMISLISPLKSIFGLGPGEVALELLAPSEWVEEMIITFSPEGFFEIGWWKLGDQIFVNEELFVVTEIQLPVTVIAKRRPKGEYDATREYAIST